MGFIEKLKLLVKARKPVTDIINEAKEIKTGYKTVQFWVTVLGSGVALVGALEGFIPASAGLVASTVLVTFYNILRGATKADVASTKPIVQTTEFWVSVLSQLGAAIVALQSGGINPSWFAAASMMISVAMAAGQNLAGQQPTDWAK